MNTQLAAAASAGITDPNTERRPGYCSRWVRQIVTKLYPGIYDAMFAGSANETGKNFLRAHLGMSVADAGAIQEGDILVKEFEPFGHIGIAVRKVLGEPLYVAENSSTPIGRVLGAKGFRTLQRWGTPQIVVRLPSTAPASAVGYKLYLNDVLIGSMPVIQSSSYAPLQSLCEHLGLDLDQDDATGHPIIGGHDFNAPLTTLQGVDFVPVRPLAPFLGLVLNLDEANKTITLSRP